MKFELIITALIGATVAVTVASQQDEMQFTVAARRMLSRKGGSGRNKKVKEVREKLEKFTKDNAESESDSSNMKVESSSSWTSPTKSNNNWDSPNSGWSSSSKSSKTPKSGHEETLFLVPFSCPRKCVDIDSNSTKLENAIQDCDVHEETQQWNIHYKDEFMKFEGYTSDEKNWCIGVENLVTCKNSTSLLSLVPCKDDQRSDWYFTGGQLLSAYCWINGVASAMFADCSGLSTLSGDDAASSSTFMLVGKDFIASIPAATQAPSVSSAPSASLNPSSEEDKMPTT